MTHFITNVTSQRSNDAMDQQNILIQFFTARTSKHSKLIFARFG